MAKSKTGIPAARAALEKCPTGISGLDEITYGGLPRGRPTLVCGGPGCGKTLFGIEFLARGITQFHEPGVLITFEETASDVYENMASLGFDLKTMVARKQLVFDHVHIERSEIAEAGEYDLDGLFIRLNHAIDSVGAKRVVLDTLESLFSGFTDHTILRAELRRLFRWLKEKGVTAVITGERGDSTLTRQGLEEYVSDCVIFLDHRVIDEHSTRRLRVVKYRGSTHGTNEYPFLIDEEGISVLPVTSLGLDHPVSNERVPSGTKELDDMLGGEGYFRGSSVLITGTAGTGKSSLAAHFADAACRRGERCLYFSFEESPQQIMRNMRSIGLDLEPHVTSGRLRFHTSRPTLYGLETHLAVVHKQIAQFKPTAVVMDPISSLLSLGRPWEVEAMLLRLVDFLKARQITAVLTHLTSGGDVLEGTDRGMPSLMDTWLLVRDIELNGERNRGLYVLKSRGMAHSNQIREFLFTSHGVKLVEIYLGPAGVLTGSSRLAQEATEAAEEALRKQELARRQRDLERKQKVMEAQIAALLSGYKAEEEQIIQAAAENHLRESLLSQDRRKMATSRNSIVTIAPTNGAARKKSKSKRLVAVRELK
jgi:circadian clock protein KaiC